MSDLIRDVHTEHCCIHHGCKYGDEDCTVTTGKAPQSYPCEYCEMDDETDRHFRDALEAKDKLIADLVEALQTAMDFIDSNIADPDLTEEMAKHYYKLRDLEPHELLLSLSKPK